MNVDDALDEFCHPDTSTAGCRAAIWTVGSALATYAAPYAHATVLPILRAGLALLPGVLDVMGPRPTLLVGTERGEDRRRVAVRWWRPDRTPHPDEPLVVLDVVIAHGDTLVALLDDLAARGHQADVTVLAALAAPEGLATIGHDHPRARLVPARLAAGVDPYGRLIPSTNGDAGDRLYGRRR
ncbi:MAG TPA: uracil phosphoribosyltransferase [Acidimicrobiales bacterium]